MSQKSDMADSVKDMKLVSNSVAALQDGREAFWELREEARQRGIQDMSLEEINAEIQAVRRKTKN